MEGREKYLQLLMENWNLEKNNTLETFTPQKNRES